MKDSAPDSVPFPEVEPKKNDAGKVTGARYFLHRNGRVYRDDGMLVVPFQRNDCTVYVKMNGGDVTRSLAAAMALAFATTPSPQVGKADGTWIAIVHPAAPEDPDTGFPSHAVEHICWTPYSESCKWSRQDKQPTTLIPIANRVDTTSAGGKEDLDIDVLECLASFKSAVAITEINVGATIVQLQASLDRLVKAKRVTKVFASARIVRSACLKVDSGRGRTTYYQCAS